LTSSTAGTIRRGARFGRLFAYLGVQVKGSKSLFSHGAPHGGSIASRPYCSDKSPVKRPFSRRLTFFHGESIHHCSRDAKGDLEIHQRSCDYFYQSSSCNAVGYWSLSTFLRELLLQLSERASAQMPFTEFLRTIWR